jgi:hypothetical protein
MNDRKPLELPDASVSDKLLGRMSTLRRVRDRLVKKGVPLGIKPDFDIPEIPKELSSLGDKEIADLYGEILAWYNYFTQETALADAEVKEKKNILDLIVVKVSKGKKKRTHDHDLDDRVLTARAELQEAEQAATILKSTHSIFSNSMKAVSRIIELRKMEWEKNNRDGNMRRPAVPHSRMGARKKRG